MFFDTTVYVQFVKDCRAIGIACPIVPGLMCLTSAAGFWKMARFCKTRVPESLRASINALSSDNNDTAAASAAKMKDFGVRFGADQCRAIMAMGDDAPPVLHFYTLNLETVVYGVLEALGRIGSGSSNIISAAPTGVGDTVQTMYGTGTVVTLHAVTAQATVEIVNWKLAGNQSPIAYLQKGHYEKVM